MKSVQSAWIAKAYGNVMLRKFILVVTPNDSRLFDQMNKLK